MILLLPPSINRLLETTNSQDTQTESSSSSSQNLVQVPAELLQTLAKSIEDLQRDNDYLREENGQLRRFQEDSSHGFRRFPKLPLEIRNLIWEFALRIPQTHIMFNYMTSRSITTDIMQACHEARNRGLVMQMSYFQIGNEVDISSDTDPKHYINLDVDTLWFMEEDLYPPTHVHFSCGICLEPCRLDDQHNYSGPKCGHKFELKRLAIASFSWKEPSPISHGADVPEDSSHILSITNARELLIVITEDADLQAVDRDIKFITPRKRPQDLIDLSDSPLEPDLDAEQLESDETQLTGAEEWDLAARRMEKILQHYKDTRAEHRKQKLKGKGKT